MVNCKKCKQPLPPDSRFCPSCGAKLVTGQKPKSRGNGTGSVYRLANGTWIAVKVLDYTIDDAGHRHKRQVSRSGFKTKKEALAYLPQLTPPTKEEQRNSTTWQEIYEKWEPTHKAGKSTINCYRAAQKKFLPVHNIPMQEITIDDLQECMDEVTGKRTQENMKALCGLLYKFAIPRHIVTLNMGPYLIVGGSAGLGKDGLPKDAVEKIMQHMKSVPYADYVVSHCYLGFRPSELLDLQITSYDAKRRAFVGGAKTEAGKDRIVPINKKIQPIIDRLVANKIAGYVFCEKDGSRMSIAKYRQIFYEVLDACGIDNPSTEVDGVNRKKYTPHSCRHTFASLMKDVSSADKDKLALIGHTSTEMLRHYQDVDIESLRRIIDAM